MKNSSTTRRIVVPTETLEPEVFDITLEELAKALRAVHNASTALRHCKLSKADGTVLGACITALDHANGCISRTYIAVKENL
jgi:hypothetical protein